MKSLLMAFALAASFFAIPLQSLAQENGIYIKLGEASTKKSLLAFPALQYFGSPSSSSKYQSAGSELFNTISNDLVVSSYFQMIGKDAYPADASTTPLTGFKFDVWGATGLKADFLIRGGFSIVGDEVTFETYTYQVSQAKLVFGKKYKGSVKSIRRIGHTFANDVLKQLTGTDGMFLSRVVVSSDRNDGQTKEIFAMDWDGDNISQLTNHRSISISPAWSPDGKKVAYTSYVKRVGSKFRNADMLVLNLTNGKRDLVSYRQGINSGAAFAADGNSIYLTISQGTNPDIHQIGLDGKVINKITNGPAGAMNVEPATCGESNVMAFSSDRAGRPMIYTAKRDGSSPTRVTFAGVFNSSPTLSPDCKKIAFAGQSDDHFDIFVMNVDGTGMLRLTSAKKANGKWSSNEDPSFSPDGRFVMYTSNRTGKNQIFISTVDGTEERRLTNDNHNYFKPKWSKNVE